MTAPISATRELEWDPSAALLFAAFKPATTARHTQRVPLYQAYAIHVLAAIFTLITIAFLSILSKASYWRVADLGDHFFRLLTDIGSEIKRHPAEASAAILGTTLGIESGFLLVAFLLMPWGASVEKTRTSFTHSLRRTWLQTPHVFWGVLIVGLFIVVPVLQAESSWRSRHQYPSYNAPAITPQMTAEQQQELYAKASDEYTKVWREYQRNQPFLVRRGGEITGTCVVAAVAWLIWALLRAVGAARNTEQISRPPTCEFCGYDLSTMKLESRCPECGQNVIESLGDDVRVGTAWQNRHEEGWLRTWLRSSTLALRSPKSLGRQLRLYTPGRDHRLLVIPCMVGIAMSTCAGLYLTLCLQHEEQHEWQWMMLLLAGLTSGLGLLLIFAGAASIGLFLSVREQRNLLPGAVQASAYLSLWLIVGDAIGWASGMYLATEPSVIHGLAQNVRMDWHLVAFYAWFPINLIWFAWWAWSIWKATVAVRYANR